MSREDHIQAAPDRVQVGVLTISDTRTEETDTSGQYLLAELRSGGHDVVDYRIVRDDALEIRGALNALMRQAQVVITSGGTGITGRDVTIPVVESLITKPMPGFGELFRMLSFQQVKGAAMLSRAVGGSPARRCCSRCPAAGTPCRPPGRACCATNSRTSCSN